MVLSARSHELLPRKCANLLFLASESLGLFSETYIELFPASTGAQLQETTFGTFPIQLGHDQGSDRKKQGTWRSGKQLYIGIGKKIQVILRRETAVSHILGAKSWCERADSTIYQHVRTSFCPENLRNCCFLPQNDLYFSSRPV